MNKTHKKLIFINVVLILAILVLVVAIMLKSNSNDGANSNSVSNNSISQVDEPNSEVEPMESSAGATAGNYITYENYEANKDKYSDGKTVYYFSAKWCPTCKVLDGNLEKDEGNIPEGLTIVKIDYDNSSDLKKKYGVTYQHTLVEVDANGNELQQWSGGTDLQSIIDKV